MLAGFWARRRIDDLMTQDWLGLQQGTMKPELQAQITQLGLDYRLMTQFTSFVAVEDKIVTKDGTPQRVEVPVEMPEGVSHEGVFGEEKQFNRLTQYSKLSAQSGGIVAGAGGGVGSGAFTAPNTFHGATANQTVEVTAASPQIVMRERAPAPTLLSPPPRGSVPAGTPDSDSADKLTTRAPSAGQRHVLESKLQPAVLAALDCFRKATNATASCANTHAGKIAVEIWLTTDSSATREQLRALGFEITQDHRAQKMLAGNLALDKLEELAKLDAIQFVSLERR